MRRKRLHDHGMDSAGSELLASGKVLKRTAAIDSPVAIGFTQAMRNAIRPIFELARHAGTPAVVLAYARGAGADLTTTRTGTTTNALVRPALS